MTPRLRLWEGCLFLRVWPPFLSATLALSLHRMSDSQTPVRAGPRDSRSIDFLRRASQRARSGWWSLVGTMLGSARWLRDNEPEHATTVPPSFPPLSVMD